MGDFFLLSVQDSLDLAYFHKIFKCKVLSKIMNLKRAILTGVLSWVLIFFEVSILMFGFGITDVNKSPVHYILIIITIAIPALIYFNKARAGLKQGLLLGMVFVVVGLILDSIITIPLFIKSYSFFLDPYLIIGFLEGLAVTIIIGAIKKK